MPRLGPDSGWGVTALAVIAALALATGLVALLETALGIENASAVFLLAVSVIALWFGTIPAVATAVGAFFAYNFLFVEPLYTLTVSRAEELLTLFLLLFVGVVISRLSGLQRTREQDAGRREREARALFSISRELATAHRLEAALPTVLGRLAEEAQMRRAWIGIGRTVAQERTIGDTAPGDRQPTAAVHFLLQRDREEGSASWTRIRPEGTYHRAGKSGALYRIELRALEEGIGSLWCERDPRLGEPELEQTRLLAATADQVAQGVARERLAAQAADAEVARRSEEVRSALLDSVSHDLRTPLATIRATAGSIADPSIAMSDEERREAARSIDVEAERLNRLVGDLLGMSRIQAGELVPDLDVYPIAELVEPVIERMRSQLEPHPVTVRLPHDLPSVRADAIFVSQAVANLLDNATTHAPPSAPIGVSAGLRDGVVELIVEDGGPGVPADALGHVFDRFYRGDVRASSRRGVGLGLSVVRGLIEAMGGRVRASASPLGGLAVTLELPIAEGRA
ncbi:MAG TPA: ATP-binding protein [Candidatus Limnocylindria bacterium]|nr:ATP-binding protein [Candidatus Limnocylindria bacterium]